MVSTRSMSKKLNYERLIYVLNSYLPEDITNIIRSFLIPKCKQKISKDDYELVKNTTGDLTLLFKPKQVVDIKTFILSWDDIYKTTKYFNFKKFCYSMNLLFKNSETEKKYFIKWLKSTYKESNVGTNISKEELMLINRFRSFLNTHTLIP